MTLNTISIILCAYNQRFIMKHYTCKLSLKPTNLYFVY